MNRYVTIAAILNLTACSTVESLPNTAEHQPASHIGETDKGYIVSVKHQDMEVSEECPQVFLSSTTGKRLDTLTLCSIKLPEYRIFDARSDFAFIDFSNYQFNKQMLTYDLDLSLLRGTSFVAQCQVSITDNKMEHQGCKKK